MINIKKKDSLGEKKLLGTNDFFFFNFNLIKN